MSKVNNFDAIVSLLSFESSDDFYFLQIISRRKDATKEHSNKNITIKSFYIKSLEDFKDKFDLIKEYCDYFNARAYINLNKRSFKHIAYHFIKGYADYMMSDGTDNIYKLYDKLCGLHHKDPNPKWLLDLDEESITKYGLENEYSSHILNDIKEKHLIVVLPTVNGCHYIVRPFEITDPKIKLILHRNNPTLLYA